MSFNQPMQHDTLTKGEWEKARTAEKKRAEDQKLKNKKANSAAS